MAWKDLRLARCLFPLLTQVFVLCWTVCKCPLGNCHCIRKCYTSFISFGIKIAFPFIVLRALLLLLRKLCNRTFKKCASYERFSISLIEKCKLKLWGTTSHQSGWPSLKCLQMTNAGEDVRKREPSYTVGGNVSWYSHCGKQYGGSLGNLKIELPCDSAIPLLGIHLDKTIIQKDTYTPMVIEEVFTIAKTWKQPKCPSKDEWVRMWYIYTIEYYWVIKKEWNNAIYSNSNATRDYHTKWSKSERDMQISYDISYMWNLKSKWTYLQNRNGQTDRENRFVVAKGRGAEKEGWTDILGLADAKYYIQNG